jgi:hypothetical protein
MASIGPNMQIHPLRVLAPGYDPGPSGPLSPRMARHDARVVVQPRTALAARPANGRSPLA